VSCAGIAGLLAVGLTLAGCALLSPQAALGRKATAELRSADGRLVGTALITEVSGGVHIVLEVRGLPHGPKAVHLHEVGRCEPPRFTSAGEHFNPDGKQHGLQNPAGPHAGDLPNLTVGEDGTGRLETVNPRVSLRAGPSSILDGAARALIVHASPDDHRTEPTGNSGARLACGVLVKEQLAR
jgi:Cu-Zn family superoxide dismutase